MKFMALGLGVVALLGGAAAETAVRVDALDKLEAALRGVRAGATVVLTGGEYPTKQAVRIEGVRGTETAPIVLRAEQRGRAVIGGAAGFVLKDCEHLVVEGFRFTHDADQPALLLDNCRHVRVTRNRFRPTERTKPRRMEHWVYALGAHSRSNRIDHNLFERKVNSGSPVFVRGDDATLVCSQHDRIDHNHFRDVVFANGANGHETIRTGGNDLGASGRSSFTVIEDNLLERCSGEGEVMSLKSSDNIVRRNTLLNCRGAICLRLGNRTEVSGNCVLADADAPGCGGVKLYGFDHRVFSNYFRGLTGQKHEAPLALVPGIFAAPTTMEIGRQYKDLTTVPPTRAWIAHNTWEDCAPLQFGFKKDKERKFIPTDCTFISNTVVRTTPGRAPLLNMELIRDFQARDNRALGCGAAPTNAWAGWFRFEELGARPLPEVHPLTPKEVGPDAP